MAYADSIRTTDYTREELATLIDDLASSSVPSGSIQMFAGTTAPSGYLLCDGGAVSRASYADLFAVIGTIYGAGDGSTTFNVPDLRQKFPLGKAASGTGNTLGATGGAIDHTHSVPAHYHGKGSLVIANDTHNHSFSGTTATDAHNHTFSGTTGTASTNQFPMRANSSAGNVGRAMRANTSGSDNDTTQSSYFSHSHSFSGTTTTDTHSHTYSGTTNDDTHNHALSGSVGNTGGADGDVSMNSGSNNPPFVVVNYIIKQ